jgi:hypothetical protein
VADVERTRLEDRRQEAGEARRDEAPTRTVRELKAEHEIRDDSELVLRAVVAKLDPQAQRIPRCARLFGKCRDDFFRRYELDIVIVCGSLEGDVKVHNLEPVLDKWAPGLPVLPAPFGIDNLGTVVLVQQAHTAIGKGIRHRC